MRNLMWAALATGCLLAAGRVVSAQDTIRLGGPSAQAAKETTDTELVHRRYGHHGGYYGGGRYYGGYYGRSYYSSYYYRPYYYPRAYSYYTPSYYYTPTYYAPAYYPAASYYYYPIAGENVAAPVTTVQGTYQGPAPQQYVPPMPPAGNGTFQYDGGPRQPIPAPVPDINPAKGTRGSVPIDGKLVSLPAIPLVNLPQSVAPRTAYPAYGDEPIVPAPRKTK